MNIVEFGKTAYFCTILLSVMYAILQVCCAIVLEYIVCKYFDHPKQEYLKKILEQLRIYDKLQKISKFMHEKGVVLHFLYTDIKDLKKSSLGKYFYQIMFISLFVIFVLEVQFSKTCQERGESLFQKNVEDINNLSFGYLGRLEFTDFLKQHLYTIYYDFGIKIISIGRLSTIIFLLILYFVKEFENNKTNNTQDKDTNNKYLFIYLAFSSILPLIMYIKLYEKPNYNISIDNSYFLQQNINYFNTAENISYKMYFILLYAIIVLCGTYLMLSEKVKHRILFLFVMYNFINLFFLIKSVDMSFISGQYMENIMKNMPFHNTEEFKINNIDSIECMEGNILINYEGIFVHLLKNLYFRMNVGNMYIVETGPLGKGIFLNHLMKENQNNNTTFVYADDNKYPISKINNLTDFCVVFDNNSECNENYLIDRYDLLTDPFDTKLRNLNIITSAIQSSVRFVGLDLSLFVDFNEKELINVLNWISKKRNVGQSILITLCKINFSLDHINSIVYTIEDGVLNSVK